MPNSFDLWGTLVIGRDPFTPDGDQPEGCHFPCAQTIAQVTPRDIVISDYYDPAKAERVLRNIAKLPNKLAVGNGIKADGSAFREHRPTHHTGDAPYEIEAAKKAGVKATLVQLSPFTPVEKQMYDAGLRGLALSMREGRLTTCDNTVGNRKLQLMQTQVNFPMLFLASVWLHRKAQREHLDKLLMCSRDAYLWSLLQARVRDLHAGDARVSPDVQLSPISHPSAYDVEYFLSSRLTRYKTTPEYLAYANSRITPNTAIVDLCGGGESLRAFNNKLPSPVKMVLLIAYPHAKFGFGPGVDYAITWSGTDTCELANLAQHAMIEDVTLVDGVAVPKYSNPRNVNWHLHPQIATMHHAFRTCVSVMDNYDFSTDLQISDGKLLEMLRLAYRQLEPYRADMNMFVHQFFYAEEQNTQTLLSTRPKGHALSQSNFLPDHSDKRVKK